MQASQSKNVTKLSKWGQNGLSHVFSLRGYVQAQVTEGQGIFLDAQGISNDQLIKKQKGCVKYHHIQIMVGWGGGGRD